MSGWNKPRWGKRTPQRPARPRRTWGRFQEPCAPALRPSPRLDPAWQTRADWPDFWDAAQRELRSVGVCTGTLRVYRHVLRHFRAFLSVRGAGARPGAGTPALAREFLYQLSDRHASWSWTATHITALRTVFDKLGGASLTEGMVTPKRPRRLHDVLEPHEVGRLLEAAGSTRDRLAILLLYGCGLKTSELCGLRWSDVDVAGRTVQVRFAGGTRERKILLPANAIPLLQAESCYRQGTDPVFAGRPSSSCKPSPCSQRRSLAKPGARPTPGSRPGFVENCAAIPPTPNLPRTSHAPRQGAEPRSADPLLGGVRDLSGVAFRAKPEAGGGSVSLGSSATPDSQPRSPISTRTAERIVRNAAVAAGLTDKEVNCRTLRRSYTVQCLRDGMDVETLRDSLGHKYVDSTLAYCRYLAPKIGDGNVPGALRQAPLPCTAFPPALGAIQCSAP